MTLFGHANSKCSVLEFLNSLCVLRMFGSIWLAFIRFCTDCKCICERREYFKIPGTAQSNRGEKLYRTHVRGLTLHWLTLDFCGFTEPRNKSFSPYLKTPPKCALCESKYFTVAWMTSQRESSNAFSSCCLFTDLIADLGCVLCLLVCVFLWLRTVMTLG